jgi:hypothetical protein
MVAAAILISLALDLGAVLVLRAVLAPFQGFGPAGTAQPLRLAVFGLAAAAILAILLLRRRLFRPREGGEDASAALRRYQRASLIVLVLGEVPAVLGLALFLIGANIVDFYALLFVSLALTFISFPRRTAWEEWLKG